MKLSLEADAQKNSPRVKDSGYKEEVKAKSREDRGEEPVETKVIYDTAESDRLRAELARERAKSGALEKVVDGLKKALAPQYNALRGVFEKLEAIPAAGDAGQWDVWLNKLEGKKKEMLQVLIEAKSLTRQQLAFRSGMSSNSGSFNTYLSKLKSLGLAERVGDQIRLRE
jgi:hypothetical protein